MDILHWIYVLLINGVAIFFTAYLLSGVQIRGFSDALIAAVVLGLVNAFIRPIALLLTLPLTVLTFGLFVLVINALMVMLVGAILPGVTIKNFWWALLFSIILSFVNSLLFWIF